MQHDELVAALTKPGVDICNSMTPLDAHLIHMVLGISGEAGELLDAIKKASVYCKPLDLANVIEELGDLEFYMQGLRAALNITREETIEHNIAKLTKRYGDKYSNAAAIQRADKIPESLDY
jgi:NTP pyrophosphatase (non-canonical NTP hydrolase)